MLTREVMEEQQITNHTLAIKRMVMTVAMTVMMRMITTEFWMFIVSLFAFVGGSSICVTDNHVHLPNQDFEEDIPPCQVVYKILPSFRVCFVIHLFLFVNDKLNKTFRYVWRMSHH